MYVFFCIAEGLLCRFRPSESYSSPPYDTQRHDYGASSPAPTTPATATGSHHIHQQQAPPPPSSQPSLSVLSTHTWRPHHTVNPHSYQHNNNTAGKTINESRSLSSESAASNPLLLPPYPATTEEPSSQQEVSVLTCMYQELSPRSSVPLPTPAPTSPLKAQTLCSSAKVHDNDAGGCNNAGVSAQGNTESVVQQQQHIQYYSPGNSCSMILCVVYLCRVMSYECV